MNKDLHDFINHLEKNRPGSLVKIKKKVVPEFEIPAVLDAMERKKNSAALVFEQVYNLKGEISKMPVLINLFGSRERLADAIETTVAKLPLDYISREKPIPPVVIDKKEAPVKEIIQTGDEVDLYEFPVITHHEMDLGPYFTSGSAWVTDPENGRVNCSIIRIAVTGPDRMVVNFNVARHMHHVFQKYKKLGKSMPMALVIGHHPAFYMGAQTKILADEPEIIGGVMGEPLEVTPSETWGTDVMVPAHAEIVIEAEISIEETDIEGPFGEYTQYYGGQRINPVTKVTAVTRKRNAYYLDIMPGHADHLLLDAPMIEAYLYSRIKEVVPSVTAVHMPVSGTARLHAYVQVKKTKESEPNTIITTALSSDYRVKHVIVVDEDIDIWDDEQVLFAVATRSQWDKDLVVISNMLGTRLDPSANDTSTAKGGIDATKPLEELTFPKKIEIPEYMTKQICLEDYFDPSTIK